MHRSACLCVSILMFAGCARAMAQVPSSPEYGIRLQEAWITLPDGVRLSTDLYLPDGGRAGEKFPVLLEYLPYRKHEARSRNYSLYSYFIQRGYVVAAVDIRGTGNSEGRLIPHEYSDIEQKDGEVVIDWLSKQPWSNGNVGMFGISWGGFNSIQMAARNVAGAQGDHRDRCDRGPLPGRRAFHGRDHAPRFLGDEHGSRQHAAGRARLRDRRRQFPQSIRHRTLDADVQVSATRRSVLGSRFGPRPLPGHPHPDLPHRRLV